MRKTKGELPSTEQISTETCRWVPLMSPAIQLRTDELFIDTPENKSSVLGTGYSFFFGSGFSFFCGKH